MEKTKFRCFRCGGEIDSPETLETAFCPQCQKDRDSRGLSRYLLEEERQYIIQKVKAPLIKVIIPLVSRIKKEPSKDNTHKPNTHVWIDIRDWFLDHENSPRGKSLFGAIWKLWISEGEHDDYYDNRIQRSLEKWLEAVLDGKWQPRDLDYRLGHWRKEEPGKGYHFIKECYEKAQANQLASIK